MRHTTYRWHRATASLVWAKVKRPRERTNIDIGGGCWHPEAQSLARLRDDIDKHPERLKNVLLTDALRKEFLNAAPKKEEKVVKAFVSAKHNKDNALKTKPKVRAVQQMLLRRDLHVSRGTTRTTRILRY